MKLIFQNLQEEDAKNICGLILNNIVWEWDPNPTQNQERKNEANDYSDGGPGIEN